MDKIQAFWDWARVKIRLHARARRQFFREREVWWCSLGLNVGTEEDGKNEFFSRPVLVLKKFNNDSLWIIPATSKRKIGDLYVSAYIARIESTFILSQIRFVSSFRLLYQMGTVSPEKFEEIKGKIKSLL